MDVCSEDKYVHHHLFHSKVTYYDSLQPQMFIFVDATLE